MRLRLRIDTNIHLNPYRLIPLGLMLAPGVNSAVDRFLSPVIPQQAVPLQTFASPTQTYLSVGDTVAGYPVTSDYGERPAPCAGCSSFHKGIDLGTPTGTPLIAPAPVTVSCIWDGGGGNVALVDTPKGQLKFLHLETCTDGSFQPGETFALTGSTGVGTGEHLDVRWDDAREPTLEDIEPWLTGKLPKQPAIATAGTGLTDEQIICAVGRAEGTRGDDCSPNPAYFGHSDPGNGVWNMGTFSYQHGAATPEQADQEWLPVLRQAEQEIQSQAVGKFGQPLSAAALIAAIDLWNQSPMAGQDFVRNLPSADPSPQEIIDARAKAFVDPATGTLDAPGLGNDPALVQADQKRRTDEVLSTLDYLRRENREK